MREDGTRSTVRGKEAVTDPAAHTAHMILMAAEMLIRQRRGAKSQGSAKGRNGKNG